MNTNVKLEYLEPDKIEDRSFEIITQELNEMGIVLDTKEAPFIKRAIHTSADFEYAQSLAFSENAIEILKDLIKAGANVVTDTTMAFSGINKTELSKNGGNAYCYMSDPDINYAAHDLRVTRSYLCMKRGMKLEGPVIFVVGNAPTALLALREEYDSGKYKPAFVIGVPVGFVNVVQTKELILETDIPYIINRGRKGGSNVAAALVNAALYEIRKEREDK